MGENINDQPYIPEVADDRKPKIQMKFASVEDAFSFYNQYAREAGFGTRIGNSKKNKASNEIVWKQFVCCKEGRTDETRSNKRAISGELKNIRVRGELRTNCKAKLSLVKQQTGPDWIVSTFVEGHNHALSTPSKVHLLRSHRSVSTVKRALTQQFSEANVPTCQKMRLLEIECGGPERIGCTERDIRNLEQELRDEQKGIDAETLIEFFTSEKERNSAFFFDYETDSINRLNKISPVTFRDHYRSIKTVIENSVLVDEFEQSWKEVIECANLEQNNWIALLYTLRHQWVPIYFSHIFWAGMSSSQRAESSHSFLKKYISNKNSLMDFITRFNRALRHQRHNELAADHIDMNEHPKIKTNWLMQTQMVKVYTKKKWMEFQSEMSNSHGYFVQQESIRDDFVVYNMMKSQSCSSSKTRVLTLDKGNDHISCSCRKFEFEEEGTKFLDEQFDYIHGKIKEMSISPTFIKESQRRKSLDKAPNINDPSEIRTKGCGKRLPSSKEKSSLKARICHGCGRTGVSHDKRNCLNLHDGSVGDDHRNNHDNSNEEDFISTVGSNNMK
ncbi:hypothetical protein C2S52_005727 [Perilla frutescens var. hirtella]|nr:hypothetical protein C2S52_005727 [Perilla frutescens var. hirtella]